MVNSFLAPNHLFKHVIGPQQALCSSLYLILVREPPLQEPKKAVPLSPPPKVPRARRRRARRNQNLLNAHRLEGPPNLVWGLVELLEGDCWLR